LTITIRASILKVAFMLYCSRSEKPNVTQDAELEIEEGKKGP
jgi:hypothetical protein